MLQQDSKKLNIIFLVDTPSDREDDPVVKLAYNLLLTSIKNSYHEEHRILILRYSLDENNENRHLRLFEMQNKKPAEDPFDFGNVKFTEPIFLGLVFHYMKHKYPAKHTVIVTWGHGFGVGLFRKNQVAELDGLDDLQLALSEIAAQTQDQRDTIDVSDLLTNTELNDAIRFGYRSENVNDKVDLLLFMNCDMMRFDTVFELARSAKYIVGPETPISFIGYNYTKLLTFINKEIENLDDEKTWERICENITTTFMAAYAAVRDPKQKKFARRTFITAVRTISIDEISDRLNELLLTIISHPNLRKDFIDVINTLQLRDDTSNSLCDDPNSQKRSHCLDQSNYDLIDVFERFRKIISTRGNNKIIKSIDHFIGLLRNAIISKKPIQKEKFPKKFNGISITLPRSLDELAAHPFFSDFNIVASKNSDSFANISLWSEFLPILLKQREKE